MPARTLRPSVVDSHLHLWDPRTLRYPWLRDVAALNRPMLPGDADLADGLVTGAVFVQADSHPDDAVDEARWVAGLNWPQLRGIVAAANLRAGNLHSHLDELAAIGGVVGVRHLLQGEPSKAWHDDEKLIRGLTLVAERGLTFDACVTWDQLNDLAGLLKAVPDASVVLDHLGKPPINAGVDSAQARAWRKGLAKVARQPHTFVKLSGLATEAKDKGTLEQTGDAMLAFALELFGAKRAMFGSDWPVSHTLGATTTTVNWIRQVARAAHATNANWAAISHRTAENFYGLPFRPSPASRPWSAATHPGT